MAEGASILPLAQGGPGHLPPPPNRDAAAQEKFNKNSPKRWRTLENKTASSKVLDGNTAFHDLLELGETEAVVDVLQRGQLQMVQSFRFFPGEMARDSLRIAL